MREAFKKLYADEKYIQELERQMPAEPTFPDQLQAGINKLNSLSPKQLTVLKGIYGF